MNWFLKFLPFARLAVVRPERQRGDLVAERENIIILRKQARKVSLHIVLSVRSFASKENFKNMLILNFNFSLGSLVC